MRKASVLQRLSSIFARGELDRPLRIGRLPAEIGPKGCEALAAGWDALLLPVAVMPRGRRGPQTIECAGWERFVEEANLSVPLIPVLEHAGPSAGRWSSERPLGAASVVDVPTGRTPQAATAADWEEVTEAFVRAVQMLGANGGAFVSVDDDGLLMGALSPRTNPQRSDEERLDLVIGVLERLTQVSTNVGIALCVDELIPRGIDLTLGARALEAWDKIAPPESITLLSTGSRALTSLHVRPREQTRVEVWSSSAQLILERKTSARTTPPSRQWVQAPCSANLDQAVVHPTLQAFEALVQDVVPVPSP